MQHGARTERRTSGPVERVDPYDLADAGQPDPRSVPARDAQARLGELRARITALDAQVAGLLARREQLTRTAFELAAVDVDRHGAPG